MALPSTFLFSLLVLIISSRCILAQQGFTCDTETPCKSGCCSKFGSCGFGDGWCDAGNCVSGCNATAECGQYAAEKGALCPLNVCCSKWGYCGTTSEFCDSECQNGCKPVNRPTCPSTWLQRRVAYYETWADTRECDKFKPEDIPVHALTHLNIAFGTLGSDFKIGAADEAIIRRITKLKLRNRALKVYISLGGWVFNDPGPTRTRFSDMASTPASRQTFINSVMDFLEKYALDGIDIDWEYPEADDRGGIKADYTNYPYLISNMRSSFDKRDPSWGISMAIPASYWYLQHFDVQALVRNLNWFNLMSYDMHGKWDQYNEYTGPWIYGHTNLTEIENALDLLRRNSIDLGKVNLGMGFYGRTYTLDDPNCVMPGCGFSDAGLAGDCSGEAGILSFREIDRRIHRLNQHEFYYEESTGSKWMVYDADQWISYDDSQSFAAKRKFMDTRCIGGVMIWAIDQDTEDFQALSGLLGDSFVTDALIEGGTMSDEEKEALAAELSGLSGDGCYITLGCSGKDADPTFASCRNGYVPVERLHQAGGSDINNYGLLSHENRVCKVGQWKTVCCLASSPAQNCKWRGAPERSSMYCSGGLGDTTCGPDQFELATDKFTTAEGGAPCASALRSLCCDGIPDTQECRWTGCSKTSGCDYETEERIAVRGDLDGGRPCDDDNYREYCCPKPSLASGGARADRYKNCGWAPKVPTVAQHQTTLPWAYLYDCNSGTSCPKTQITMTKARLPDRYPPQPGFCQWVAPGLEHRLCCDPPRNVDLPFNPYDLFTDAHDGDDLYVYKDDYGNNDRDPHGPEEQDYGDDPYGFILLDGAEDALQGSFPRNYIFVHDEDGTGNPIKTRDTFMSDDPHLMRTTFEHEESWHYVYCHKGRDEECSKVFIDGAQDTIITLPPHIGSGPYARIVSMELVDETVLPDYHLGKRALEREHSQVYKLVFDYAFDRIKRATPVNLRVDYTNMVNYWDEMTGLQSGKGSGVSRRSEKRFWGEFVAWIKKLTSIELSDMGKLPMHIKKTILLYRYRVGCPRGTSLLKAGLDITATTDFNMNARWAYYVSGTIVPLDIHRTYAYFGVAPTAELTIEMKGSAELKYNSLPIKLIDTLAWPGLAIKGIAAIGPTLDLYGRMDATMTVSGQLRAGAKVTFPSYEVYFPQNDESEQFQKWLEPNKNQGQQSALTPILDASVTATVGLDLVLTPELNLGISVGLKSGTKVVDAQIVAFVNNTLSFNVEASAQGTIGGGGSAGASYKIWIDYFYNFGIGGRATFISFIKTTLKPRTLWEGKGQKINLYTHEGSVSTGATRRSLGESTFWNNTLGEPIDSHYDWFQDEEAVFGSPASLSKRLTYDDLSAFGKGLLQCADGGTCSSGNCDADSCQISTQPDGTRKRAGDDPDDPMDVDVEQCITAIPAIMYNCKYFPDRSMVRRVGAQAGVRKDWVGICSNILNHMSNAGLGAGPIELTYDEQGGGSGTNRNQMCGSKILPYTYNDEDGNPVQKMESWAEYCQRDSDEFSTDQGLPTIQHGNQNWASCDEFPFNSVMEGGQGVRACAPGYQQQIQGVVNGLPKFIDQLVPQEGKLPKWRQWDTDWGGSAARVGGWNSGSGVPRAKKSFTFHLFSSDTPTITGGPGGQYQIFNHDLVSDPEIPDLVTDIRLVIGAVNIANDYGYRITRNGGNNAYCDMGFASLSTAWGNFVAATGCKVKFDNGAANAKIKRGIKPSTEDMVKITSVEFDHDAPIEWIPSGEPTSLAEGVGDLKFPSDEEVRSAFRKSRHFRHHHKT